MRAVVMSGRGGPEVLRLDEVPDPVVGPGLVRVRVRAAGMNRADLLQRMGQYGAPPERGPEIPGLEFAGVIDALGEGVSSLKIGDRVFGITSGGAQAERLVVPERGAVKIPDALDDVAAGGVPEAFVTAHDALFTIGQLRPGERVLVHAVGSGVGLAALQLAKVAGAVVLGTSRTPGKLERAAEQGLDVGIDSSEGKWAGRIRATTSGRGVDLIADFLGGSALAENLASLAERGRLVVIGLLTGGHAELDLNQVLVRRLRIQGTVLRARPLEEKLMAVQAFAREVVPLLAAGRIKPVVDRVYPAQAIQAAHMEMAANENFGKIVLTF
ncbi:MAG: NAD(P)H-quinone oxidoreductase [Deltaproteobacteria bacterium]|nr:NAD(P)H-quinone oxidoreductase [Deltaproteobacteria bacterium]